MFSIVAFAVSLAQAVPPATPKQEARIQSTLGVAVEKMASRSECNFPAPKASDFVAVIGANGGSAVPTVTVAGQDEATYLADLTIGEGHNPVYLVLTSQEPVIWRISGDAARVRQLIIFQEDGAGVVGIPASKVQFNHHTKCRLSYDIYRGRAVENDVRILATFGRRPNAIGGDYMLYRATLDDAGIVVDRSRVAGGGDLIVTGEPAETIFPQSGNAGPGTLAQRYRQLLPAGVVEIDPDAVVTSGTVERYKVLPQIAGAYQLERSGAIVAATAADVRRWKDRALIGGHVPADQISSLYFYSAYRVTRPIRLPADLCGAYSMTFFVPSRDFVKGNPCHSNIYVDDGTIMAGH